MHCFILMFCCGTSKVPASAETSLSYAVHCISLFYHRRVV